jgi:putative GTP pyrophosphokinase
MAGIEFREGSDGWASAMLCYNSALKEVSTKVEILSEEFKHIHKYNPIEYVKTRIKSADSINKKLIRYGYEPTTQNMIMYCNDVAGVRIVCSFTSDIYRLSQMIGKQDDITVISVKDYIKNPKESGYKSYHMIVEIPIYLSSGPVKTKVEIQIRTIAMDFWASLEHKIFYKFEGSAPTHISEDLRECSEIVSMLDAKMLELNDTISAAVEEQERAKREEREAQIAEKLHLASIEKSNQKKAMENAASNKKRA